jgi:hypothetical protein
VRDPQVLASALKQTGYPEVEVHDSLSARRPAYARAAVEILANLPAQAGQREFADAAVAVLEQLFTAAQEAGEMRPFDPVAMAVSVRAAIDAAATRSVTHPVDLRQYAGELVELFDRATATEARP